jgi:hypothetical protein
MFCKKCEDFRNKFNTKPIHLLEYDSYVYISLFSPFKMVEYLTIFLGKSSTKSSKDIYE